MSNVLKFDIDPEIKLDESLIKGMPEDLKGHLLSTLTFYSEKYGIHWTKLKWTIKMNNGEPTINIKRKQ